MNKYKFIEYIITQSWKKKIPLDPRIFSVICVQELYDYIVENIHPELIVMSNRSQSKIPKEPFWKESIGIPQGV